MTKSSGVYQLSNGMWGVRYAYWVGGKQKDIKRTKDKNGNPFKTRAAALKARKAAINYSPHLQFSVKLSSLSVSF